MIDQPVASSIRRDTARAATTIWRCASIESRNRAYIGLFEQFEPLFQQKHTELARRTAKIVPFPRIQFIAEGSFFVLNGVMFFIAEVGRSSTRIRRCAPIAGSGCASSSRTALSPRCTGSRPLGIRMGEGYGQDVVPAAFESILADNIATSYGYVLRSLIDDPQISGIVDLHKIEFSRGPVEGRIAHAEKQPTYLMASVEMVASYRTYNMWTSALENLLHRVFAEVRLDVSKVGKDWRRYEPSEWYVVPLRVIDQAVSLIASGYIVDFVYDAHLFRLRAIE